MDALLNQLWQRGLAPFDGDCLVTDDFLSGEELLQLLGEILSELERGYASKNLYTFEDWHQHDGYVTERRVIEWAALVAVARSADALVASRHDDTYVHRSFYPEGFDFLLRYELLSEDTGDASAFFGRLDISAHPDIIARMTSLVALPLRSRLRVEPSKSYFDRIYAG